MSPPMKTKPFTLINAVGDTALSKILIIKYIRIDQFRPSGVTITKLKFSDRL